MFHLVDNHTGSDSPSDMMQVQRGKASKCVAAMMHRAQAGAWRQWTGRVAYRRLKLHAHHALRSRWLELTRLPWPGALQDDMCTQHCNWITMLLRARSLS